MVNFNVFIILLLIENIFMGILDFDDYIGIEGNDVIYGNGDFDIFRGMGGINIIFGGSIGSVD